MKQFFFFVASVMVTTLFVTACMDDDDPKSEATVSYVATCSGITYTDSADVPYEPLIVQALGNLGLVGSKSVFEESASVNYTSLIAVYAQCNEQAEKTYKSKLEKVTMAQVKNTIYASNSDSLYNTLGIERASDIPIHEMTVHLPLYNSMNILPIDTFYLYLK